MLEELGSPMQVVETVAVGPQNAMVFCFVY
jgi:hypothetical protein